MKLQVNNKPIEDSQIRLIEQSYNGILKWPSLKSVDTNDWAEHNGIEPDLTNPVLENRNVTLKFYAKGIEAYEFFVDELLENGYNTLYFPELYQIYMMRLVGSKLIDQREDAQYFELEFTEDNYSESFAELIKQTWNKPSGFCIDNVDLCENGISVLEGTIDNIRQLPKTKQRLTINENSMEGSWYDSQAEQMFTEQDVQMFFLIRARNVSELISNYYYFLKILTKPSERVLYCEYSGEELPFYYKSQNVQGVVLNGLASGLVGIEFSINICITERRGVADNYLYDDLGNAILTTDNDNILKEG